MILSHLTTSIDSLCLQDNMQTYKKKSYAKFSTATLNIFLHISLIHCMSYSQWITHQSLFGCCVYLNSCSFVCGQHLSLYMPGFIGQSPNDSLKLSWNESPWFPFSLQKIYCPTVFLFVSEKGNSQNSFLKNRQRIWTYTKDIRTGSTWTNEKSLGNL